MERNRTLPEFGSLDELVEFFESHDFGDYWDELPEAAFDVAIRERRHLFALDADLAERLNQVARQRKVSSEALIDAWLREKLREVA